MPRPKTKIWRMEGMERVARSVAVVVVAAILVLGAMVRQVSGDDAMIYVCIPVVMRNYPPTATIPPSPTATPTATPTSVPGAGAEIAFVSNRDGNPEIYSMNADGTGPTRLTYNATTDSQPAWSPDGARIAFYSKREGDSDTNIYVMNAGWVAADSAAL